MILNPALKARGGRRVSQMKKRWESGASERVKSYRLRSALMRGTPGMPHRILAVLLDHFNRQIIRV